MPSGPLSVAIDELRTLIAATPYFRTWTGTASTAAARARVIPWELRGGDEPTRPFAAIFRPPSGAVQYPLIGIETRTVHGRLEIWVEADVAAPNQGDAEAATAEAEDAFGQLIAGLDAMSGGLDGATRLMHLSRLSVLLGPEFVSRAEAPAARYARWRAAIEIEWGLGG